MTAVLSFIAVCAIFTVILPFWAFTLGVAALVSIGDRGRA